MNSQLMKMEALVDGYDEAIALDVNGFVSEGSGQNLFAVIKGELVTPPLHNSILAGITARVGDRRWRASWAIACARR